jgi:endonuclease G, mitochondrial
MPFPGYFSIEKLGDIADAIVDALGVYGADTRAAVIGAVPNGVSGLMSVGGPPMIQLQKDLLFLNNIQRLADGTVPLIAFLRQAARLGGAIETINIVRDALSELETRTTGAPRIDLAVLPEVKERIIGRDDMVSRAFLTGGLTVASAVARLEVPRFADGKPHMTGESQTCYRGTGWMIGPRLLITNHHVFNARNDDEPVASEADFRQQAQATRARFDYDFSEVGGTEVVLAELVASDLGLDYAVSRVDIARAPLEFAETAIGSVTTESNISVNIIQHPDGRPKRFGIRNNLVTGATDRDLRYFTDTEGGSSGSPVLNDEWKVVALHRGSTFAKGVQYQGRATAYVNLGTQIHAIFAHIRANAPGLATELGLQ